MTAPVPSPGGRRPWLGAAIAAALLATFGAGWVARALLAPSSAAAPDRRVRQRGFRLISPLLDVELPEGFSVRREPIPFKHKVKALVDARIAAGDVRDMAVYWRDLGDGPWFGINEKVRYDPASMMKVPVMIAWLKRAEADPAVLGQRLTFDAAAYPGGPQTTAPSRTLTASGSYTVEELIRYMVSYSDNRAMWLLFEALRPEELGDVLDNMDVANDPTDQGNRISAHGYSGFLRILYNAAYLNRRMSEKALELLSHQDFPQGMVGGVPPGVTVASKFGEVVEPGNVQLHEFGIVYHRGGPYILGIMTHGNDLARQAAVIRDLSALVYAEVDAGVTIRDAGR